MTTHRDGARPAWLCALLLLAACGGGGGGGSSAAKQSAAMTDDAIDALNTQTSEGLTTALADLEHAVELDPQNGLACFLLGGVRLVCLADDCRMPTDGSEPSALAALIDGFGVDVGQKSVFDLLADLVNGDVPDVQDLLPLPDDSPQGSDLQAFLSGPVLDAVRASAEDWERVRPSFSEVVPDLMGLSFEVDYGDVRLLAAAARGVEAGLRLQSAFVLEADIDELANWQHHGMAQPYRIFTGDSPGNIVIGATTPTGRKGFFNEPVALDSALTLLPAANADAALDGVRQALLATVLDLQAALNYVDDPDPSDDLLALPPEVLCPVQLAGPWIADVVAALQGGDVIVEPLSASDGDCAIELPGFTLDAALLFSSATWDGRLVLPDYPDGTTTADAGSWAHLLNDPAFLQIFADFGGSAPTGEDLLELWNGLNELWDIAFAGEPLETAY